VKFIYIAAAQNDQRIPSRSLKHAQRDAGGCFPFP
jgi:hypothetical protein